jgi:hypothetical protein
VPLSTFTSSKCKSKLIRIIHSDYKVQFKLYSILTLFRTFARIQKWQRWPAVPLKDGNSLGGFWCIFLPSKSNPTRHFCSEFLSHEKRCLMEHFVPSTKPAVATVWSKCNIQCLEHHKAICPWRAGACCCGPTKGLARIAIYTLDLEKYHIYYIKSQQMFIEHIHCAKPCSVAIEFSVVY